MKKKIIRIQFSSKQKTLICAVPIEYMILRKPNFWAFFIACLIFASLILFQSIPSTPDQTNEADSEFDATNTTIHPQHDLSTQYTYSLNDTKNALLYNASFSFAKEFQVYGEYLFFIREDYNLGVLNLSNHENIQNLEYLSFPNPIIQMQLNGTMIYVATNNAIYKIDITNPANMQFSGAFGSYADPIISFLVVGSTLYLITHNGINCNLHIFTENNWGASSHVGYYNLGTAYYNTIVANQQSLLIGSDSGVIQQVLVSDPTNPIFINSNNVNTIIRTLRMFGNFLLVTDSVNFVIMSPDSLSIYQSLPISNIVGYSIQGNLGYFANSFGFVYIINMTDMNRMNTVARVDVGKSIFGFEYRGDLMLISTIDRIYAIQTARILNTPMNLLSLTTNMVNKVRIFGYYAYVCTTIDLRIIDLRNNSIVGIFNYLSEHFQDCYQNGNILYILCGNGMIRYVSVIDPTNPAYLGAYDVGTSNAWTLRASGNFLFACFLDNGLRIVNMSNPTSLQHVATISNAPGSLTYDCAAVGNRLYVANYNELCVYDISTITAPINVGNLSISYLYSVEVSYPYLFVGTAIGYTVYNITSPMPLYIMAFDVGGGNIMSLKRTGEALLIGAAGSGFKLVIVKDPRFNQVLYNNMSGLIYNTEAFCDKMIISKGGDGFSIAKIRETPLDFSNGFPFLERFWRNTTQTENPDEKPPSNEPGNNSNEPSPINWNTIMTYGGPPLAIFAIVYLLIKAKGQGGPKAKKFKSMTKGSIEKGVKSNQDEFFDSDL